MATHQHSTNLGRSLGRKIGPVPVLALVAVAVVLGWYFYNKSKAQSSPTSAQTGAGSTTIEPVSTYYQAPGGGAFFAGPTSELAGLPGLTNLGGQDTTSYTATASSGAASPGSSSTVAPGQGGAGTSPGSGAGTPGTTQSSGFSGQSIPATTGVGTSYIGVPPR